VQAVRSHVPHYEADRYLADELSWAQETVLGGGLCEDVLADFF
jgi:histidine ammonia-lyase